MPVLTNVRHELFAQEVAKGADLIAAYSHAGFKAHESSASRLRTDAKVASRIDELLYEAALATRITVGEIEQILASIARFDLGDVVEWGMEKPKPVGRSRGRPSDKPVDGSFVTLKNSRDLPPTARRAISKIKRTQHGVEIVPHDKLAAIRILAQHLGMLKDDKDDKSGTDALVQLIVQAHRKSQGDNATVVEGTTLE